MAQGYLKQTESRIFISLFTRMHCIKEKWRAEETKCRERWNTVPSFFAVCFIEFLSWREREQVLEEFLSTCSVVYVREMHLL